MGFPSPCSKTTLNGKVNKCKQKIVYNCLQPEFVRVFCARFDASFFCNPAFFLYQGFARSLRLFLAISYLFLGVMREFPTQEYMPTPYYYIYLNSSLIVCGTCPLVMTVVLASFLYLPFSSLFDTTMVALSHSLFQAFFLFSPHLFWDFFFPRSYKYLHVRILCSSNFYR